MLIFYWFLLISFISIDLFHFYWFISFLKIFKLIVMKEIHRNPASLHHMRCTTPVKSGTAFLSTNITIFTWFILIPYPTTSVFGNLSHCKLGQWRKSPKFLRCSLWKNPPSFWDAAFLARHIFVKVKALPARPKCIPKGQQHHRWRPRSQLFWYFGCLVREFFPMIQWSKSDFVSIWKAWKTKRFL